MKSDPRWRWPVLIWLGVFGLDAVLSMPGVSFLSTLSTLLLLAYAPVMAVAMVFSPRFPARVVGPPLLFLGWTLLGAMPISIWFFGSAWLGVALGGVQLGILALCVALAWQLGPWEQRPALAWRRAVALSVLIVLAGPVTVAGYAWGSAAWGLHALTGGYAGLDLRGVYLTERTLQRGDTTVHLAGMMHVGEARHYEELFEAFGALPEAVVLAEGVSDSQGLLTSKVLYDKAAKRVDLVQQPSFADRDLDVRPTDVDVSEFSPETLELLNGAFAIWGADNPLPPYLALVSSMQDRDPEALVASLKADLIDLRNRKLLVGIAEAEPDFAHVIVPWGALHLPDIHASLEAEGWRVTGQQVHRPLIRYTAVLSALF